jgi:hypothetical protein
MRKARVVFWLVKRETDVILRQNLLSKSLSYTQCPSCLLYTCCKMPGIVRKLLIFAAVDGLVLQPAPPRNHKPATDQAIKLSYKTNAIAPLLKDRRNEDTAPSTLEAHGIVGIALPLQRKEIPMINHNI